MHSINWFVQSSSSCRSHASVRSLVLVPGFDSTEFVGYRGCRGCNMPTHGYQPAPMDGPSI